MVFKFDFNVDGCKLLDKMQEDEWNLEVLNRVCTSADDTQRSGTVCDGVVRLLEPGTEETSTTNTDGTFALVAPMEESVLEQEVRGRSFHNNGRIRFSSVALTNHRLVLVCFYILC